MVNAAGPADAARLGRIIARAFHDDPVNLWVFGSEHAMRATHVRARIPMANGTDSLNVATSAAIAFYERDRSFSR